MNNKIKNNNAPMILFDLDGTLWDSAEEVTDSWNEVIREAKEKYGKGTSEEKEFSRRLKMITLDDMHSVMGKTMGEIAAVLMPDCDKKLRDEVFAQCSDHEIDYIKEHGGRLFPGTTDVLQELLEKGYRLSVVSNCQTDYVKAFMTSMNTEKYFCDYEEWGRTGLEKGLNIRLVMERNGCPVNEKGNYRAIYVGDTQKDFDAAKCAGIPFVLAEYGFGNAVDPAAVIDDIKKLPETAEKILGKI